MNAPALINSKGIALANDILSGNLPKVDHELFTDSEWKHAAQMAVDCDDYSELLAMYDEEQQHSLEEEAERRAEYSGRSPMRRSWMECA